MPDKHSINNFNEFIISLSIFKFFQLVGQIHYEPSLYLVLGLLILTKNLFHVNNGLINSFNTLLTF